MSELQPVISLSALTLDTWTQGDRYAGSDISFGAMLGLRNLGASYNVVPPGKSSCPFHVHHAEDEMFVILEGVGEYRFGEKTYPVKAGDVLGAPAGDAAWAHQLINTGTTPIRYLGISTNSPIEVVEYPDSGKFLVSSRRPGDKGKLRFVGRAETTRDYWEGEPGA